VKVLREAGAAEGHAEAGGATPFNRRLYLASLAGHESDVKRLCEARAARLAGA